VGLPFTIFPVGVNVYNVVFPSELVYCKHKLGYTTGIGVGVGVGVGDGVGVGTNREQVVVAV
jgi:hypothetical protein